MDIYRRQERVYSIQPCAFSKDGCLEHALGRHLPLYKQNLATRSKKSKCSKLLKFLAALARFKKPKRRQCHLFALPVELLQEIASYLSLDSRISFTLSCKALYHTLGSEPCFHIKRFHHDDYIRFLTALQRDMAGYRLCQPCKILHSPTYRNVEPEPNVLRKRSHPGFMTENTAVSLLAPRMRKEKDKDREVLYWLSRDHVELAIAKNICLWTIRCSGVCVMEENIVGRSKGPLIDGTTFSYTMLPVLSQKNMIFHAKYEIEFPVVPWQHWSHETIEEILSSFDIRCCIHCSTPYMAEEMAFFLGYPSRPCHRLSQCVRNRVSPQFKEDTCNEHTHGCDCTTEYKIEAIRDERGQWPVGLRVYVWQWFGPRGKDATLKERGMLRNLYEDSVLDFLWSRPWY
ncbi:hypothetical protein GQ43DRAFT_464187 [Delitschia confertaspora ATCC 74209]|uniref:F-box domain-containing protein n=1 Tax=Delitschia confertaspora ATCC 74209 TaxID=1513339 RepID=A0A9P4JN72_9PLEO|nr:hypothetical protein GQ43DRAFT_464187 [Delitschia confertaspora ATCC 74209]